MIANTFRRLQSKVSETDEEVFHAAENSAEMSVLKRVQLVDLKLWESEAEIELQQCFKYNYDDCNLNFCKG